MPIHYNNGTAATQSILSNILTRLSHILSSDHLLPNKIHPAPGNQWWILCNMSSTHRKNYYKAYYRIMNHSQRAPRPTGATASGIGCRKCNTYSNQRKIKWQIKYSSNYLTQLKVYMMTILGNFRCNQTEGRITYWRPATMMQTTS